MPGVKRRKQERIKNIYYIRRNLKDGFVSLVIYSLWIISQEGGVLEHGAHILVI